MLCTYIVIAITINTNMNYCLIILMTIIIMHVWPNSDIVIWQTFIRIDNGSRKTTSAGPDHRIDWIGLSCEIVYLSANCSNWQSNKKQRGGREREDALIRNLIFYFIRFESDEWYLIECDNCDFAAVHRLTYWYNYYMLKRT